MNALLAVDIGIWIAVGAGALALVVFLYGVFRRFTRCSWLSWQIWLLFAATFLLDFLPEKSALFNAVLTPVAFFAAVALVLAAGGWARYGMLARRSRAPAFFRFTNRFLGGVTAVLNVATFFAVLGGAALAAMAAFGVQAAALDAVYANPVWTKVFAGHAFDLLVIAVCVLMVRCGYRVGLMRALWAIVTVALVFGSLVLAIFMANKIGFLVDWAAKLAASFEGLGAYASLLGKAIVSGVCFLVLLIVVVLLSVLINVLMKKLRTPTLLRAVDGALLAIVFAALFFAVAYGVNFGVYYLANGGLDAVVDAVAGSVGGDAGEALAPVAAFGQKLAALFTSSPLSARLYEYDPLVLILGK